MARRTYIAVFDITDPDIDLARVQQYVRDSDEFPGWWHYLPSAFLLRSELEAGDISVRLKPLVGDANFLVMEVDPADSDGWLPKRAWEWIKKRARTEVGSGRNGK